MNTHTQNVTVNNRFGLHMRPVAEISKMAYSFDAIVAFHKDDKIAHGHSVVEMLMLGAFYGDIIKVSAIGNDAQEALQLITKYVENYTDDCTPKKDARKETCAA
jgi:phosphotransferase system HPr (HPr) family protein